MPPHASSSSLTVLSDGGCARSCASRRSDPGSGAVPTTINAGQMRTSQVSDCSHYPQPAIKRDAPDEETNDRRAVCGRTASTVRREGRRRAFPTPIVFLLCEAKTWMAGHRRAEATPSFRRLCPAMTSQDSCVRSSVGVGQNPFVTNLRLRVLPEVIQRHAASHGGDEDEDAGRQRRKTFQRGPRAQANKPPTYSK